MRSPFIEALANTRLYALTDRQLSGLSHAEQVSKLHEAGVTVVQLREKFLSSAEFYEEATDAMLVARRNGMTLIVNDRVDIALALKAEGVHLGQDDVPADVARRLLGEDALIGLSTHNLAQAYQATKMPVSYLAIGPIFSTSTKQSENPPVGLKGLREAREAIGDIPLVAIGGITSENSQHVLDAGADAIAVIKDLWNPARTVTSQTALLLHRRAISTPE